MGKWGGLETQMLCWQVLGMLLECWHLGCLLGRLRNQLCSAHSALSQQWPCGDA